MPDPNETISEFLRNLGVPVEFALPPGHNEIYYADGVYGGVDMRFWVYMPQKAFSVQIAIGWIPKAGVAALYRQMLNQSFEMLGATYSVLEARQGPQINLGSSGFVEGLTLAQFKTTLDNLTAQFWSRATALVRDFQIPQDARV